MTKKRSDWSEYADLDEEEYHGKLDEKLAKAGNNMIEPIIVTELPKEMIFKKPKLKGPYSCPDKKLLKPAFPSKRTIKGRDQNDTSEGIESTQFEPTRQFKRPILRPSKPMAGECLLKPSVKAAGKAPEISKWSSYISDEDGDDYDDKFEPRKRTRSSHDGVDDRRGNNDPLETLTVDEKVEDDIHPDFI